MSDDEAVSSGQLTLLSVIPIKDVVVYDMGTPFLIPSGQPFGIKLLTDGVMVTDVSGFDSVKSNFGVVEGLITRSVNRKGGYVSPAKEAGIRPGDVIKTVSTVPVKTNADISRLVSHSDGEDMTVVFERDGNLHSVKVTPERATDGNLKIGMWVRDSSAGIGTLTFFDPVTNRFAGLGHPVCDSSSGALMPLYSGEATKVRVGGVIKGRVGAPGELTGTFLTDSDSEIGKLMVNSYSGVYGEAEDGIIIDGKTALPLGTRSQITEGKAVIISTTDSGEPESFEIEIESINQSGRTDGKDMVIRVTDEKLLSITGGIVQGMSGSPVIQNGRIIGAVTHVFVNNPEKGYAIFADTMYTQVNNFNV
jgi:stage IV sporulation protein B